MNTQTIVPVASQTEFYNAIQKAKCLREGHLVFHDLHHEFYLNPVLLFNRGNEDVGRMIGKRLSEAVGEPIDHILIPEHSEAVEFGSSLASNFNPIPKINQLEYRKKGLVSQAITPYLIPDALRQEVKGKAVLFIDSGTVTGQSVLSVRDGLVRAKSRSIHIITLFHRMDDEWANNLTGLSGSTISVKYYYFGRLFLPVWRSRDCPWESEEEYWRGRIRKFHSSRAQDQLQQQLRDLEPILTSTIDWDVGVVSVGVHNTDSRQLNLPSIGKPTVALREETFLKFRLANEYFAGRPLTEILSDLPSNLLKNITCALAVVSVTARAISLGSHLDELTKDAARMVWEFAERVIYEKKTSTRDKWKALGIIRQLSASDFANALPVLIRQVQLDPSLFLALDDNIYSLLESNPGIFEHIRAAFDVARHRLDNEYQEKRLTEHDYQRSASVWYDLRQDQNLLLPIGRTEYALAQVLFPLRQYITGSRPQHVLVAKSVDRILRTLAIDESILITDKDSVVNEDRYLPVRLQSALQHWKDEVYQPLQEIHSLLERLLERQFMKRPVYLTKTSSDNMLTDIEQANASVLRLSSFDANRSSTKSRETLREDLKLLRESLTRLHKEVFEEGSSIQELVQVWFPDLRKEIEQEISKYNEDLREGGIILKFEWNSDTQTVLCYREHLQHALENFFNDVMKQEGGPFAKAHQGTKLVSIEVRESKDNSLVQVIWEDTGVGINDEAIQAIDDLASNGTLSRVKIRLRRVGGDLRVERKPDAGTRFTLDFIGGDI